MVPCGNSPPAPPPTRVRSTMTPSSSLPHPPHLPPHLTLTDISLLLLTSPLMDQRLWLVQHLRQCQFPYASAELPYWPAVHSSFSSLTSPLPSSTAPLLLPPSPRCLPLFPPYCRAAITAAATTAKSFFSNNFMTNFTSILLPLNST